ncbi:hypothetical protein HBB12_006770 [Methylobacterium sp. SyP6R]|nr:hypothetical protein [Methylobacterium sp. SyP6R]
MRDLGFGTSRGDQFRAVVLGTAFNDVLGPVPGRESQPHYINGGESNDTITGGSGHDVLIGALGNDVIRGGTGDDAIFGGSGNDVALFNVTTDGADRTDLESGLDRVDVSADAPGQIRLTFTSSEVGDGRPVDLGGSANQDGGLAVRLQAEGPGDTLTGPVSRFDDEGITFAAAMDGLTFDVRDLVSGTPRGDRFGVVVLGSSLNDVLGPVQGRTSQPHYINGGQGNDTITGGSGDDVLVGGSGDDLVGGGDGDDTFIDGPGNDTYLGGRGTDTLVLTSPLTDATVRRSGSSMVLNVRDTYTGIERFQFTDATVVTGDGQPLVDDLFYLTNYRDVFQAGQDADTHYAAYGWKEGRDPNALFSTTGYLAANPGVRASGQNPLEHYDQTGWKEGRDPSAGFDNEAYLARNPDVKAAGIDPLKHFLEYGQAEGRQITDAVGRTADLAGGAFDAEYYLLANPDVARAATAAGGDSFAYAAQHFEQYGWRERRNPNAVFNTAEYLIAYRDVQAANINPLTHYDQYGWKEGRDPSRGFDTSNYLAAYGDVAQAGLNPMQHYLQYGLYEGRGTFADLTLGYGNQG